MVYSQQCILFHVLFVFAFRTHKFKIERSKCMSTVAEWYISLPYHITSYTHTHIRSYKHYSFCSFSFSFFFFFIFLFLLFCFFPFFADDSNEGLYVVHTLYTLYWTYSVKVYFSYNHVQLYNSSIRITYNRTILQSYREVHISCPLFVSILCPKVYSIEIKDLIMALGLKHAHTYTLFHSIFSPVYRWKMNQIVRLKV